MLPCNHVIPVGGDFTLTVTVEFDSCAQEWHILKEEMQERSGVLPCMKCGEMVDIGEVAP